MNHLLCHCLLRTDYKLLYNFGNNCAWHWENTMSLEQWHVNTLFCYNRQTFVYMFWLISICFFIQSLINLLKYKLPEYWKSIPISVICENLIHLIYLIHCSFREIIFEKNYKECMIGLVNVFAFQQFCSFLWLLFLLLLLAKCWKLHKLFKLTISFNFWI